MPIVQKGKLRPKEWILSGATGKVKVYNSQFLFSPKLIEKKLILLKLELMLLFFLKNHLLKNIIFGGLP